MGASRPRLIWRGAIHLLGWTLLTGCALSWSPETRVPEPAGGGSSVIQWSEDEPPTAGPAPIEDPGAVIDSGDDATPAASPPHPQKPARSASTLLSPARAPNDLPLVIVLPHTGGTAQGLFAWVYPAGVSCECAILLIEGRGSAADYATNEAWAATLARYEAVITRELAALRSRGLRPRKILLAGFSMGGDMAWALNLRNPSLFDGGLVMGSRMSYRNPAAIRTLRERQPRFFLTMGDQEQPARVQGMERARAWLAESGIAHEHHLTPGAHVAAPAALFEQGLRYLIADD